jgi:RHH-type proline utilization regulon transcriptional repressor/proline dehydrogenase/delta 1-pyrroline-5-carboxylate dehydrogenase
MSSTVRGATTGHGDDLVEGAVVTAERWAAEASRLSRAERRTAARLAALLADPDGLDFATGFVDRVARAESNAVAARQLVAIVRRGGRARFLSPLDRVLLRLGAAVATLVPGIVVPLARLRLRQLVGHLVADATPDGLTEHLARLAAEGMDVNVNLLGEAVLGEREALARRDAVVALLGRDDVDYVSVKLSAIAAQLTVWDLEATIERVAERLRPLYRAALAREHAAFVNLDVEEYRDLDLTVEVFTRVLMEEEFLHLPAGIVLQAYLPDALPVLRRLLEWSDRRGELGGADVRIRFVKGANLSMEVVDAELHGWPRAPYDSKLETDANYRRLVDEALRPERLRSTRIGLASHNLFDVAWALALARERGVADRVDVEMLQGMAPGSARAVRSEAGRLRLYTPTVAPDDFDVAISYLVRRLEEAASPENFLRTGAALDRDPVALASEAERFRSAVERRGSVAVGPRRTQDRRAEERLARGPGLPPAVFANEPDTDPSLASNRAWAADVVRRDVGGPRAVLVTDPGEVDRVVAAAARAAARWRTEPAAVRRALLHRVADELARRRGDLVAAMVHEGRKVVAEADPEVSEAIDFARYYAERALDLERVPGARFEPMGVVVVVPPWNFPVAIPGGGAFAAIAAGAAAIVKPAPETPRCAEIVCEAAWAAGVGPDLLAFLRVPDDDTGRHLITHADVDAVVLTGSFETARLFRSWRPDLALFAETSGKNALIITPAADLDLAAADLVRSAFGHAGQKCSAASLGILVGDVADSTRFLDQLVDATTSLAVGAPTALASQVGPLIGPPRGPLARHLVELDAGERWLVEPRPVPGAADLWTPGIKTGVVAGSHFHTTECFGPVLGLMRARDLDEAIELANATGYGLTGGIHSLDDDEVERWLERVEVGNAYVNRHITGAIVQRQPFGGWKRSSVGPGAKAGGPAYVAQFGRWTDAPSGEDRVVRGTVGRSGIERTAGRAVAELVQRCRTALGTEDAERLLAVVAEDARCDTIVDRDASGLACEENSLRLRPHALVTIRLGGGAAAWDVARALVAAGRCGGRVELSTRGPSVFEGVVTTRVEDDEAFAARVATLGGGLVRAVGTVAPAVRAACEEHGVRYVDAPPVRTSAIELPRYLREQAVSRTRHRYGRVTR